MESTLHAERAGAQGLRREDSQAVIARAAPPILPEGRYWGPIVQVETARSAFPPRKRDRDLQRDQWKLYIHVRLERGDAHDRDQYLGRWRTNHDRQSPVIFVPVPFRTLHGKTAPEAPRIKDKLFKLISTLAGDHRLQHGQRFDFEAFVGLYALVDVRTCVRDCDGDTVPANARYSFGRKILALRPPSPTPWVERGVVGGGLRVSGQGSAVLTTGNSVGSSDGSHTHPQPGGGGDTGPAPSGSTPSRREIEAYFGRGADVGERGPCPACGSMRLGRAGESGVCLRCKS